MATQINNLPALKNILDGEAFQKRVSSILGRNAGSFVSSVITLANEDGKLRQCQAADIAKECLRSAALRLSLVKSLGQAYIVPFFNVQKDANGQSVKDERGQVVKRYEPQFIIGYKGLIQLALRTHTYQTINADVVHEGELVSYSKLTGYIDLSGKKKSDKVIGYFAYIKTVYGFEKSVYMSVEEVAEHAKKYAPACLKMELERIIELANAPVVAGKIGWLGDFSSQAVKTCLRKVLGTYGEVAIDSELGMAMSNDAEAERTISEAPAEDIEEVEVDIVAEETAQLEATVQQPANEQVEQTAQASVQGFSAKASF